MREWAECCLNGMELQAVPADIVAPRTTHALYEFFVERHGRTTNDIAPYMSTVAHRTTHACLKQRRTPNDMRHITHGRRPYDIGRIHEHGRMPNDIRVVKHGLYRRHDEGESRPKCFTFGERFWWCLGGMVTREVRLEPKWHAPPRRNTQNHLCGTCIYTL